MAQENFSSFYADLYSHLPGCPDLLFDKEIIQAVREFCGQSRAWVFEGTLSVTSGTTDYALSTEISIPDETEILSIEGVERNESDFWAYSVDLYSDNFELNEEPNEDFDLTVWVALRPILTVSGVEDWIYNRYKDTIISGVCKCIMLQPNQRWTNPELAKYHESRFKSGTARARISKNKNFQKKSIRVSPKRFI